MQGHEAHAMLSKQVFSPVMNFDRDKKINLNEFRIMIHFCDYRFFEKQSTEWNTEAPPEPNIPQPLNIPAPNTQPIPVPRNKPTERQPFRQQPPPMKVCVVVFPLSNKT